MDNNVQIKNEVKKTFARHRLDYLAGFKKVPSVDIPVMPKEWSLFPKTTNQYWKEDFIEGDKSACLYRLPPKGVFPTHKHLLRDEYIDIITKNVKVELTTELERKIYKTGERMHIPLGMEHALESLENIEILFRVIWSPKLKGGFEAEFRH